LIEERRRDLPNVHNRPDAEAARFSRPADPEAVLDALKEHQLDARSEEGVSSTAPKPSEK
jgi:hypothetical protein